MSSKIGIQKSKDNSERFDEVLRQAPRFAEALERVKRLEAVLARFESPLKPADASTKGKWSVSRLALHYPEPE